MEKRVTIGYYLAFIALGLGVASLGPTLPGLAEQTKTTVEGISILFAARSAGFLIGALLMGRLYDRFRGHHIMASAIVLIAIMMAVVPLTPVLWLLTAVFFLLGLFEPGIDVGGNTLIVWLHRDKVGPYMNGLHFFFGVGAFLSPIIIAWAIATTDGIEWAYWVLAGLMILPAIYISRLPSPTMPPRIMSDATGQTAWLLVGLIAVFFFLYAGAEVAYGGWIFSFAISEGVATETTAAYLTSAFWGALTIGRLIAIPIATRFRNRTIIFADLIGCLAAVGLIILRPQSATAVWVGTIGLGLFMASVFPTTLSLAERHLHVSGKTTSYFFVGASVGGMTIPYFIGQQFETVGPLATMTTIFACLVAATAVFGILVWRINLSETKMVHETSKV